MTGSHRITLNAVGVEIFRLEVSDLRHEFSPTILLARIVEAMIGRGTVVVLEDRHFAVVVIAVEHASIKDKLASICAVANSAAVQDMLNVDFPLRSSKTSLGT